MRPDAMQLLAGVEAYLGEVLDKVPVGMRSDVRAAAKSLADARKELEHSFPLMTRECGELAAACAQARQVLGESSSDAPMSPPLDTLSSLTAHHAALRDQVGELALALQAHDDPAARAVSASIYKLLREQGGRRLGWQSVFPTDRLVSDVLESSWPRRR